MAHLAKKCALNKIIAIDNIIARNIIQAQQPTESALNKMITTDKIIARYIIQAL